MNSYVFKTQLKYYFIVYKWHLQAIVFAIILGWMEQHLLGMCGMGTGEKIIFGQFSAYHVVLLMLFVAVAWDNLRFIPLMILVEDWFYHLFSAGSLGPDAWVNWFLGGFYLFGVWVPTIYILLFIVYIILELRYAD